MSPAQDPENGGFARCRGGELGLGLGNPNLGFTLLSPGFETRLPTPPLGDWLTGALAGLSHNHEAATCRDRRIDGPGDTVETGPG